MAISRRQARAGKQKSDPNLGSLHSSSQDQAAAAQVAQMKAMMKAMDPSGGFGSMQQFLNGPSISSGPNQMASIQQMLYGQTKDLAARAATLNPIRADRDWATLYSMVPDGTSLMCAQATGDLSSSAMKPFPDAELMLDVSDVTGVSSIKTYGFTISDDDLRRDDDAVSRIIDRNVTETLAYEANRLASEVAYTSPKYPRMLGGAVQEILEYAALYPVIWFADKLEPTPSGAAFVLRFAIQWVYEPSLDQDDDEEDE